VTPATTTRAPADRAALLGTAFAVTVWGFNAVLLKAIVALMPVAAVNTGRLLVASAGLLVTMLALRRRPRVPRRWWAGLFLAGLLGTSLYQFLFLAALSVLPAGVVAVVGATNPAWVALLGLLLGERVPLWRRWGIALSVLGVAVMGASSLDPRSGVSVPGLLVAVAASVSWALYTLASRPFFARLAPLEFTALSFSLGSVPYVLLAWPSFAAELGRGAPWPVWAGVVASGLFSNYLGFLGWMGGVRALGASRAAAFLNVTPVVSLAVALVALREPVTPLSGAAALVTLSGVALANRAR
jgi:drug/metabolite transporter (DMT)-like permease